MGRPKKIKQEVNLQPEERIEEVVNTAPKAVTLQGKTVNQTIAGKVRLFNVDRQKIITGFIPIDVAKDIVKQMGNIIIYNENNG